MITRLLPLLLLLSLSPAALASSPPLESASLEDRLLRQPYDYETRQLLLHQYLENDNQARAYYHAAWLAWLAPPSFADPAAKLLAERAPRERASRAGAAPAAAAIAIQAQQRFLNICFEGALAQHLPLLRRELDELLSRAEIAARSSGRTDPVPRLALIHIMLLLDDALAFDNSPSARRARPAQLRTIASRTAALVDSLPESPGARRLLAITRARQASLDNRASSWQLALEQAEAAYRLDPHDPELPNLLWTLSLRAGQWEQALHWQALTSPPSLNSSLTCLD